MRFPTVALAGGVITTVLSVIHVVVALGLGFLMVRTGHVSGGELLITALIGGVGLGGAAVGIGAMRLRRGAVLAAAGIELAWAAVIGAGVLVARGGHSAADRDLVVVFVIPAGGAALAGLLCLIGSVRGGQAPRTRR